MGLGDQLRVLFPTFPRLDFMQHAVGPTEILELVNDEIQSVLKKMTVGRLMIRVGENLILKSYCKSLCKANNRKLGERFEKLMLVLMSIYWI